MKCPECVKAGLRSTVTLVGESSSLVMGSQWWDEEGKFHDYDPNITTADYKCSAGHRWSTSTGPRHTITSAVASPDAVLTASIGGPAE
jgi:hypothetical protein